ncbi:hypothetical protein PFICI_08665 [Pestalotiopsis fici W106-1]|uniref:Uncharacterized protein n=1 Tax=Pestalotiopsis fici (strain W106-1 / CGMCC3.15140) TaxID=1229662 RepID=W3X0D1_PESFW|nr:uncharacterized protein PFICI_08665 [Pestalotiopsis fici W106-1]ETS78812.1 hypothetical protein PFICI_08665 [Pestalotiopsis fici W106-1]
MGTNRPIPTNTQREPAVGTSDSIEYIDLEATGVSGTGDLPLTTYPMQDDLQPSDYQAQDSWNVSEEICYGMLHDIGAEVRWSVDTVEQDTIRLPDGLFLSLSINFEDKYAKLQTTGGFPTAVLNNRTHQGLSSISNETKARAQVIVEYTTWVDANNKFRELEGKETSSVCFQTRIILSGLRDEGNTVAKLLANCNLYLQEPMLGATHLLYENPQSLDLPHPLFTTGGLQDIQELETVLVDDSEHDSELVNPTAEDMSSLLVDIDAFLNNMPVHAYLQAYQEDRRILSSLLPHQREGVDFMNRREIGICPPEVALWKLQLSTNEVQYYRHVITGAKSPSMADCRGGILADDMGLGKTLTTLSAIVGSLDRAREFALFGGDRSAKTTIIVVPSELLMNTWENEIKKHIMYSAVSWLRYHGPERHDYDGKLSSYDLILTTYGTAMVEFRDREAALYGRTWYRVVLDEAHVIRNSSSKQFEAVSNFSSNIRWCLTGTPIQNSLDDLGSLVRYLKVPVLEDGTAFRKHISKLQRSASSPKGEFENLKLLLSSICMRRTKNILPGLGHITTDVRPEFSQKERQRYSGLEIACKRAITLAIGSKSQKGTHHGVMQALLRLRMFCNNGLCVSSTAATALGSQTPPDEVLSLLQQGGQAMCSYCSCDIVSISSHIDSDASYLTQCLRLVCHECTAQYRSEYQAEGEANCPLCQSRHQIDNSSRGDTEITVQSTYPSKIQQLVQDVQAHYMRDKCVIFSFWKKTLDIVEGCLVEQRLSVLRIDGDVTTRKRNAILSEFQSRSASRILLMTFSTGAVGLNGLTVANRVHILEPQWNPAVEHQAIGRLLRIDQAERVTVIRYMMRRSIEEVVQSKQHRKLQLAGGGFASGEGKAEQLHHLTSIINQNTG